jgi:ATPase family protein associated with various cellular activities (AAA)
MDAKSAADLGELVDALAKNLLDGRIADQLASEAAWKSWLGKFLTSAGLTPQPPPVPAAEPSPDPPLLSAVAQAALVDCLAADASAVPRDVQPSVDLAYRLGLAGGKWVEALRGARAPEDQRLADLAAALGLAPIETLTAALLVSLEEDPIVARTVASLQAPLPEARPTLGLLATAFEPVCRDRVPVHALLGGAGLASGLFSMASETGPLVSRPLAMAPALYMALRGLECAWPGTTLDGASAVPLSPSILAEARRQAEALGNGQGVVIRTAYPAEGRAAAAAVAEALGRRAVFVEREPAAGFGPWLRVRGLLPVFCHDLAPGERRALVAPRYHDGPIAAITGPDGTLQIDGAAAPEWDLGVPSREDRELLWSRALGDAELARRLAGEQRHSAGRIAELARAVQRIATLHGSARPTFEHVRSAATVGEASGLTGLATPLRESVDDEALVVSNELRKDLELLMLRCRRRDGLSDELGASAQARYHPGVRALFVGPSGTGKTLAVAWIASRLGMPLYRVDLAAVTSKYIGETEKNLAQLLARAEHAGVILLFDEADSMFGKRTDIKDANDRFANAQTNYLLQRIEVFDGVAILTSNNRSRFDAAFMRRLDAVLDFPAPGPDERRALWVSHLGAGHRISSRSLNKLASEANLAGGHIRNAVLAGAVLAQSKQRPIEYADLIVGLSAELRKLGLQLPHVLQIED